MVTDITLTEAVRRRPYQVVLFDEIEKAHSEVFNILLQVLDEGRLTDGQGRTVDFRNTIIIQTSNIGSEFIGGLENDQTDPEKAQNKVMDLVRKSFRPEYLNRLDEIIIFHSLSREDIRHIVRLQVDHLIDRLKTNVALELKVTDAALDHISIEAYDPIYGARPVKRFIQREIENLLAKAVLAGKVSGKVTVDVRNGEIVIN